MDLNMLEKAKRRKKRLGPMTSALLLAFEEADLGPIDAAAMQLAKQYARLLDDVRGEYEEAEVYTDLGPKLAALMKEMGLTPVSRRKKENHGDNAGGGQAEDDSPEAVLIDITSRRGPNARARQGTAG